MFILILPERKIEIQASQICIFHWWNFSITFRVGSITSQFRKTWQSITRFMAGTKWVSLRDTVILGHTERNLFYLIPRLIVLCKPRNLLQHHRMRILNNLRCLDQSFFKSNYHRDKKLQYIVLVSLNTYVLVKL